MCDGVLVKQSMDQALQTAHNSHFIWPCCLTRVELLNGPTCDIFFDVMDLADGVVTPKHVQIEGLGVFSHAGPHADVRRRPPG